jgi:murein hydrolase activator
VQRASRKSLAALLALTLSPAATAADPSREDIDSLRTQIRQTVKSRKQLQADYQQAQQDLQQQELELAAATRRLTELRDQSAASQQRMKELTQRSDVELNALNTQRDWLARILRAQYLSGEEDAIKLLLRQDDPARVQRILSYHEIVTRKRMQSVAVAAKSLNDTRLVAENVRLESERLRSLTAQQARTIEQIKTLRAAREKTIATLNTQIAETNQSLEKLRADKRALEKLLYSLPSSPAASSTPAREGEVATAPPSSGSGLQAKKGKLPWPVKGKLSNPFTDAGGGAERHHGVYIAADAGLPVDAIEGGIVRFADWFQGFGLLVIIDHGDGFISLYGHNQSLGTKSGDSVKAGQVIAQVGNSGGQGKSGLYFAIRHNGKPLDPSDWCR